MVRDYWAGNPMGAVASLAELEASTGDKYFYDTGAGTAAPQAGADA